MRRVLRNDDIAGAVMLVSPEVEESEMIRAVEAPEIFRRVGRNDGFFVQIVPINVPYRDVDRVLGRAGGLQETSRFNMEMIESDSLETPDARRIAKAVLKQRLGLVRAAGSPVSVTLDSRGSSSATGVALRHDFTRYFSGREAIPATYSLIESALLDTAAALADTGDRLAVRARGLAALPLGVLFGAVYSRFSFDLSWIQPAPDGSEEEWSLRSGVDEIATTVRPILNSVGSEELVLAVSVNADVESAVADYLSRQSWSPRATIAVRLTNGPLGQGEAITAQQGLQIVRESIGAVRKQKDDLGMKRANLHVFLAGPLGMAVLIGQHLNTFGECVVYEHLPNATPPYSAVHRFQPSDFAYP